MIIFTCYQNTLHSVKKIQWLLEDPIIPEMCSSEVPGGVSEMDKTIDTVHYEMQKSTNQIPRNLAFPKIRPSETAW